MKAGLESEVGPPAGRFRILRLTKRLAYGLVILFIIVAACQRWFLFYNWGPSPPFPPTREIQAEDVSFQTTDGRTITGLWAARLQSPASDETDRPVVLFCHGNSGDLKRWRGHIARWQDGADADVLVFDYGGYGSSTGSPSEAALYEDAMAAYGWLTNVRKIDPDRIILAGQSLGGGPAVYLAAHVPHRMLILESSFTSIPGLVRDLAFGLPIDVCCFDEFPNEKRLRGYTKPLLVSHGTADWLIGYSHAERLFEAAQGPKVLLPILNMGHHDLRAAEYTAAVRLFVKSHWK